MQELLGGDEVYHYHTKVSTSLGRYDDKYEIFHFNQLMMKEARTGGAFLWHQDYGYWYGNGCMLPEMGSVFIAIDKLAMT